MTELQVTRSALGAFASSSDGRHRSFESLVDKANEATVDSDSFGMIPGIGSRCYGAYHDHVSACIEGIGEASLAMRSIADGVRATKQNYDTAEDANTKALATVEKTLGDLHVSLG